MKLEATVKEIRALLDLAEVDRTTDESASETRRQGRETAARRVPRRLLDRYQLLLEVGRTPVVVCFERGVCSGCHVRLPTMLEYKAHRSPAIHTCPHCRRMLYAPELLREAARGDAGKPLDAAPQSAGSPDGLRRGRPEVEAPARPAVRRQG